MERVRIRVGDQLELRLNDVRVRIPWGGQSPRELTKVGLARSLKADGASRVNGDASQTEIFRRKSF